MATQQWVLCIVALHISLPTIWNTPKYPRKVPYVFFVRLKPKFGFSQQIFVKVQNIKSHENPSSGGPRWRKRTNGLTDIRQKQQTLSPLMRKRLQINYKRINVVINNSRQQYYVNRFRTRAEISNPLGPSSTGQAVPKKIFNYMTLKMGSRNVGN